MKYVKFKMVDSVTGISIDKQDSANGITLPNLGVIYDLCQSFDMQWYYAVVDDDAPFDPENRIFEITFEEYSYEIGRVISDLQNSAIEKAYEQEKEIRKETFSRYHESATTAGIQKYQEALDLLSGGTASESLQTEATARGVSVSDLAQKIVDNHNKFRETDAKLSGLRGKIVDRIKSFVYDPTKPYQSFLEYSETEYVPNVRIPSSIVGQAGPDSPVPPGGPTPDELVPLEERPANRLGKHVPDLMRRWEYLLYIEQQNTTEE